MAIRWKPSVTVAAVIERDGRFLLVEEQTQDGLRLNNPAGHLDPGESLPTACAREVLEEPAFSFEPEHLVGVYLSRVRKPGDDFTYLRFAFCGRLGAHDPKLQLDEGIVRTLWMTADEIRASRDRHRSPLLVRCIDDYLAGVRHPLDLLVTDPSVIAP